MIKITLLTILTFLLSACGSTASNATQSDESSSTTVIKKTSTAPSNMPMLAILINYDNIKITSSDTVWSNKLFGKNENQLNHYYLENSAHKFEFLKANESSSVVNDGVISVSLNKNHPSTSVDSAEFMNIVYPDLKSAILKVDSFIDFSNYDTNADGYISNNELIITFIMAGYEDSFEGSHVLNGIWAHQSCMIYDSEIAILDSVTLMSCQGGGNFAIFGERHDKDAYYDATIGIIAHELGHATFGLPDLYNTVNPNSGGIGYFGIMGAGTWTTLKDSDNPGTTPTHFCAWSKVFNGWVTPTLENNSFITLYESSSENYNIAQVPINSTSYYLLENRNNSGYDRGLNTLKGTFKGGIAIWKIDETKLTQENFQNNTVNADTNNKGVDLVEASASSIDIKGNGGAENALYYQGNRDYFLTIATDISQRSSAMTLNIH